MYRFNVLISGGGGKMGCPVVGSICVVVGVVVFFNSGEPVLVVVGKYYRAVLVCVSKPQMASWVATGVVLHPHAAAG